MRAGRHAVDFIHEQQVGEDRTSVHAECSVGGLEYIAAQNVGGNQIGSALHALELQIKKMREAFHGERFSQPRDAFDQRVASREDHDEQLVHRVGLAHDDLRKFFSDVRSQRRGAHLHAGFSRSAWPLGSRRAE